MTPADTETSAKEETQAEITPEEAKRGIYIHYEGLPGKRPALIGILVEEEYDQAVLDRKLDQGARAEGVSISTFSLKTRKLIEQADEEDRLIFAFGMHEMEMVREHSDYGEELEPYYRDLQEIALAWFKENRKDDKPKKSWKLEDYLSALDFSKPTWAGRSKPSKRIKTVRNQLMKKGELDDLTSTTRKSWQKVLRYNRRLVAGLQLLGRTVTGLEATDFLEENIN